VLLPTRIGGGSSGNDSSVSASSSESTAYVHACIHTCMHTYLHTHMHTYLHAHAYILTHTCIHTYTHMHTYLHTHTCIHKFTFLERKARLLSARQPDSRRRAGDSPQHARCRPSVPCCSAPKHTHQPAAVHEGAMAQGPQNQLAATVHKLAVNIKPCYIQTYMHTYIQTCAQTCIHSKYTHH
jgi:hypothetical protein